MSEQLKESLSAVMDGEADEFEIRRVLNEAAMDPELRGVWERYHLVRSVLRGETQSGQRMDMLTARLWRQIDADANTAEPSEAGAAHEGERSRWGVWSQRIAGVAVAAGVATAVIVGFGSDERASTSAPEVAVVEPVAPAAVTPVEDESVGPGVPASLDLQRAHAYMLHHARHVALNNRSSVPFVKVAAFESK